MTICTYFWAFYNSIYNLDKLENYPSLITQKVDSLDKSKKQYLKGYKYGEFLNSSLDSNYYMVEIPSKTNQSFYMECPLENIVIKPGQTIKFSCYTLSKSKNATYQRIIGSFNNEKDRIFPEISTIYDTPNKWIFHKVVYKNYTNKDIVINDFDIWCTNSCDGEDDSNARFFVTKPMLEFDGNVYSFLNISNFDNNYNLLCNNFDSLLIDNVNGREDRFLMDSLPLFPGQVLGFDIYTKKMSDNSSVDLNIALLNNFTNYSDVFNVDFSKDTIGKWTLHKEYIVNNKDTLIWFNQFNWNYTANDTSNYLISKPMLHYGVAVAYNPNPYDSIYQQYYDYQKIKNHFAGKNGLVFDILKSQYWDRKDLSLKVQFLGNLTNFTYLHFSHFGHPSYIGFFVLFVLIVLMYILFFIKHKFLYVLFYLGQILYFVFFLFLVQSRTNLIAFLVVAFAFGVIVIFRQRKLLKSLLFVLVIVVSFFAFMRTERFSYAINNFKEGNYQESNARVGIWLKSIDCIKEKPILGYGLGDCDKIWKNWYQEGNAYMDFTHAHNQFLQAWLESGILGFLILCLAFVSVIVYAFKKKNYILILFWLIVVINLCFECMFMYHKGVTSVTPLIYLFLMKNPKNIVEK